ELSLNNAKTYGEEYSEIEQEDDDNMTQSEIDGYSLASTSKSSDLTTFLDVCTPQEKAKLDVLFHIVENHYWIEFFRHLRPAYKLPSRH
ncbi:unnamed protein product, partial [Tenebrio molitor]